MDTPVYMDLLFWSFSDGINLYTAMFFQFHTILNPL